MSDRKNYITECQRSTPVFGDFDVVVVGGGIAGVAASVAAAREDVSVCLVEKENGLGGLATLGLVVVYLPLCDGRGNQVIGGLGEELLKLSLKYGPGQVPAPWAGGGDPAQRIQQRYRVTFNPASFIIALEELALGQGIELMYDSRFCGLKNNNGRIEAVVVENKSGRIALRCRSVIDASGDADVAYLAGNRTVSRDTNRRSAWFFSFDGKEKKLHPLHDPRHGELPEGAETFAGDDCRDVTRMNIESRKLIMEKLRTDEALSAGEYPLLVPLLPLFRMTRRLQGIFELDEDQSHTPFPDTVGLTGDWRRSGPVFSLPYRCLHGRETSNLLTAGRCISVTDAMWDITRVIPTCAMSGQAAGVAAALAAERRVEVGQLDITELQDRLKNQGVIFDMPRA